MDKIHKRLPIQHRNLRSPVVFAFNVLTNHYLAFQGSQYRTIQYLFQKYSQVDNFYLLPNITNVSMTIEERSAQLAQNLKELAEREALKGKVHLVAHSFTGVDSRAALALFGSSAQVRSLTTICSPHLGMRLIDNCEKHPERCVLERAEKAIEAVGLSQSSAQEFTSRNLADFNKVVEDAAGVEYFSLGAHKQRLQSSELLRSSHESIVGPNAHDGVGGVNSDGLVRPEEARWGRYLLTFPEHDHLEIAGFNADYKPYQVCNLVADNLRLAEIKEDPREAREYGVDGLFTSNNNS